MENGAESLSVAVHRDIVAPLTNTKARRVASAYPSTGNPLFDFFVLSDHDKAILRSNCRTHGSQLLVNLVLSLMILPSMRSAIMAGRPWALGLAGFMLLNGLIMLTERVPSPGMHLVSWKTHGAVGSSAPARAHLFPPVTRAPCNPSPQPAGPSLHPAVHHRHLDQVRVLRRLCP